MTFTKVSNPFLSSPPKWLTWPLDICGEVGYGWFYWFSLHWKNFFPNLSEVRIFFPVQFFFSIIRHEWYFFSVPDIFLPGIYLHAFFLLKSVCRTVFLKSPITPSKVKWSAPKLHQIDRFWFVNHFWRCFTRVQAPLKSCNSENILHTHVQHCLWGE